MEYGVSLKALCCRMLIKIQKMPHCPHSVQSSAHRAPSGPSTHASGIKPTTSSSAVNTTASTIKRKPIDSFWSSQKFGTTDRSWKISACRASALSSSASLYLHILNSGFHIVGYMVVSKRAYTMSPIDAKHARLQRHLIVSYHQCHVRFQRSEVRQPAVPWASNDFRANTFFWKTVPDFNHLYLYHLWSKLTV